jgi:hypothetical protein
MMTRRQHEVKMIVCVAALVTFVNLTSANAAPEALKGKTIAISWTEVRNEKVDNLDSAVLSVSVSFQLKVYVSEKGRAFTRMTRNGGPGSGRNPRTYASDQAPVDQNALGTAGNVSFSSQKMMATRTFSSGGARQVSAVFDGGFTSCQAHIIVGKQRGSGFLTGRTMSRRNEYIFSSTVSGESCTIAAGNEFG